MDFDSSVPSAYPPSRSVTSSNLTISSPILGVTYPELRLRLTAKMDDSAPDYSRAKSGCTQPKRLVFRQLVFIRARNVGGVCKSGCIVELLWYLTLCCASVST